MKVDRQMSCRKISLKESRIKLLRRILTILTIPSFFFLLNLRSTVEVSDPPPDSGDQSKKDVVVIYFPQFHRFPENDRLWGAGFTDFSNTAPVRYNKFGYPVLRPEGYMGFYDLADKYTRSHQAHIAKSFGIKGFAIYHYWFKDKPVMSKPLEQMIAMNGSEPRINFFLVWANEPWTRTWDGQDGSEILIDQDYDANYWATHFEWILPYLKHPNAMQYNGGPIFAIYRPSNIPRLVDMLNLWREMGAAHGLDRIFFLQINGVLWKEDAWSLQNGMDGVSEFFPNYYQATGVRINQVVTSVPTAKHYFFGACSPFDNTPRHRKSPDKATILPLHPENFYFWVRQNLARTSPGSFLLINAWNEWGEGAAIEPSIQWGNKWISAIEKAIKDEQTGIVAKSLPDGRIQSLPLRNSGVMNTSDPQEKVCIIIRVGSDSFWGMFNVHQTLHSLKNMEHENWRATIVYTDLPFLEAKLVQDIRYLLSDPRVSISHIKSNYSYDEDWNEAYRVTDQAVYSHCHGKEFDWLLVTNGDNWYSPDALNGLQQQYDIILMNFYSRYKVINEVEGTNSDPSADCCLRVNNHCVDSRPMLAHCDLGALIIRADTFFSKRIRFDDFREKSDEICGVYNSGGCHDGVFCNFIKEDGWKIKKEPPHVCSMHHNPNPVSCSMIGGMWFDTTNRSQVGCYYAHSVQNMFPIPNELVKFENFMHSDLPCFC